MFKKRFAKYARAVSDDREREWLYRKYRRKTVVSIIFYALCAVLIALSIALGPHMEQDFALTAMGAVSLAWIGFAIANLCLWISFVRTYSRILKRPASSGEMPEVTAYRQKAAEDKKTTFRQLWWAWLIFGICVVVFTVCMIAQTVENPDGEWPGAFGDVSFWVLLAGSLTLAMAYIINGTLKQQNGNTFEQKTEGEAKIIDTAQGREHEYNLRADANLQTFKYIFPNKQLYSQAEKIRKKYSKILTLGVMLSAVPALVAAVIFLSSEAIFGNNIVGYAIPVSVSVIFATAIIFAQPLNRKLSAVEKLQKAQLESTPEYAKNLEWYKLYEGFNKFKGKIFLIFIAVSVVLGWVLAIAFPSSYLSCFLFVPMAIGLIVNNRLVRDLRKEAIVIEREIDKQSVADSETGGQS